MTNNYVYKKCVKAFESTFWNLVEGTIYATFSSDKTSTPDRVLVDGHLRDVSIGYLVELPAEELEAHLDSLNQLSFDTMEDKLYSVFTNTGGWGGCGSSLVVARTAESALIAMRSSFRGQDVSVSEASFSNVYIVNGEAYKDKYTIALVPVK